MSHTEATHRAECLRQRRLLFRLRCRELDLLEHYAQQLHGADRQIIRDLIEERELLADGELEELDFAEQDDRIRTRVLAEVRKAFGIGADALQALAPQSKLSPAPESGGPA